MSIGVPLPPGSTIGIFGSGQLGRMLTLAAARLGLKTHIFAPTGPDSPAAQVAQTYTQAEYEDLDAVKAFAENCDALTYEFENVPAETAKVAAHCKPLHPSAACLNVAQDRLTEKLFISEKAGVPVAPFEAIDSKEGLKRALQNLGGSCVLKTRRFGYDGKGQMIIRTEADIEQAWDKLGTQSVIAEAFIPFVREVSVLCARGADGQTAAYPLVENVHQNHILHTSTAPAPRDMGRAKELALNIMQALDYVGVMATEFFELEDGSFLVNEIAPRVHNSGHWTQDAGCTDQFEQHIRAVAGWPLGNPNPKHGVVMTNLIGKDANDWKALAREENSFLHLYGKNEAREGRKMGHVNRIVPTS